MHNIYDTRTFTKGTEGNGKRLLTSIISSADSIKYYNL